MSQKKSYIIVAIIFVLAFVAGNLVYPQLLKLPKVPDVAFKLGLDLQGGTHLVYQANISNIPEKDRSQMMQGLRDVIERRVNFFGVSEPVIQVQGERLIVELAGVIDPAEAIRQIGQTPFLEFKEQKDNYDEILASNQVIQEKNEGQLEDPFQSTSLNGKYLEKAEVSFDQTTYQPLVSIQFNSDGAKIFEELTKKNVNKLLAIYIDGVPISIPKVNEAISGGKAQISGKFTVDEARSLARNLTAGALPVPIELISQQTIGPTLGKVSLDQSLKAGIIGFLGIILFMIIFYRLPGLLASLALIFYTIFVLTIFKFVPVTLTLAGIAGFLLSIGMAVDANILIFARMKEEFAQGKNFQAVVEEGFKRAWPSIRDSNFNSLIVCAILFGVATSFIKGFALTLGIGVLISMLSAIFVTENLLKIFIGTKIEKIKWLWR